MIKTFEQDKKSRKQLRLERSNQISNLRRGSIRERNITEYTDRELVSILKIDPCNKKALLELTNRASNKLKD